MDPNEREWDALAGDILWKISGYLETEPDILRFRSVCRRWRSSTLPLPPKTTPVLRLPCFNPNPGGVHDKNIHCTLSESTIYRIEPLHRQRIATGASPCWVVRVQFSESGTVVFKNLGSPELLKTRLLPKFLDLRDYKVSEIRKAYTLMCVDRRGKTSYDRDIKVAVSSCFSEIGVGFMVMALKKEENLLGIWRIGDDRWNFDIGPALGVIPRKCFSIAYHSEKFYALDDDGGTSTFDPVSFEIGRHVVPQALFSLKEKHLVQAFGDLYLVACNCSGRDFLQLMGIGFMVRKLDEQRWRWVQVEDVLKQCLLLVTPDWLAMVSAKDVPGYEGNCVYHVHHTSIASGCGHLLSSSLVPDPARVRILCGYPCCSKLFWPPPTWLRENSFISRMGISSYCPSLRAILLIFLLLGALWLSWLSHDEDYFTRFLSSSLLGYHIPLEYFEGQTKKMGTGNRIERLGP
ncbi:hypothetical protein Tsubulata_047484, partial [Turnera subulata]